MSASTAGLLSVAGVFVSVVVLSVAWSHTKRGVIMSELTAPPDHSMPSKKLIAGVATLLAVAVMGLVSPKLVFVAAPIAAISWLGARRYREQATVRAYEQSLPHALDAVSRSMRSGSSLLQALREAAKDLDGPVAADIAVVTREVNSGVSLSDGLRRWRERRDLVSVRVATASLALSLETGAAHAQAVDRVSMSVRQSLNAIESARTHATQSRSSAMALTCLPLLFTGPLMVTDPEVRHFLLDTWVGIAVLATGLLLDGLGALWMARLVRRVSE